MWDKASTVLAIGPSGSGKTRFAVDFCKRVGLPVRVLNGSPSEYQKALRKKKVKVLDLTGKLDEKRVIYIVDDLVKLEPSEQKALLKLLNVASRHNESHCIILTHGLYSTGVFSLLQFITKVVFTPSGSNLRALRDVCVRYLCKSPGSLKSYFDGSGNYVVVDMDNCTVTKTDRSLNELSDRESKTARQLESEPAVVAFVESTGRASACRAILQYLSHLWPKLIDSRYGIRFGIGRKVNLLDYLYYATAQEKPPPAVVSFQRWLSKKESFPSCLVLNKKLKDR